MDSLLRLWGLAVPFLSTSLHESQDSKPRQASSHHCGSQSRSRSKTRTPPSDYEQKTTSCPKQDQARTLFKVEKTAKKQQHDWQGGTKRYSQHASIPPKPLRRNVQTAPNRAALVVRSPDVDDQHRCNLHRQNHLSSILGHDASL